MATNANLSALPPSGDNKLTIPNFNLASAQLEDPFVAKPGSHLPIRPDTRWPLPAAPENTVIQQPPLTKNSPLRSHPPPKGPLPPISFSRQNDGSASGIPNFSLPRSPHRQPPPTPPAAATAAQHLASQTSSPTMLSPDHLPAVLLAHPTTPTHRRRTALTEDGVRTVMVQPPQAGNKNEEGEPEKEKGITETKVVKKAKSMGFLKGLITRGKGGRGRDI
jgi:hypothetical protein